MSKCSKRKPLKIEGFLFLFAKPRSHCWDSLACLERVIVKGSLPLCFGSFLYLQEKMLVPWEIMVNDSYLLGLVKNNWPVAMKMAAG